MEVIRRLCVALLVAFVVGRYVWTLDVGEDVPVAVCPKVEYRVKVSKNRQRIRLDTITTIPEECR